MALKEALQKHVTVAVVALCGGFLGGTIHDWSRATPTTVRAKRFEVIDPAGRVLSYWGPDSDPRMPAATPKGILLVFMDPKGVRRCQIGSSIGDYSPELHFYDKDGPSGAAPQQYAQLPRLSLRLGWSGSPTLYMKGQDGDTVALGALYGDVYPERELGWGLTFRAWANRATAHIGYHRWWDGSYQSAVTLDNGAGRRWNAVAGNELKPYPLHQ